MARVVEVGRTLAAVASVLAALARGELGGARLRTARRLDRAVRRRFAQDSRIQAVLRELHSAPQPRTVEVLAKELELCALRDPAFGRQIDALLAAAVTAQMSGPAPGSLGDLLAALRERQTWYVSGAALGIALFVVGSLDGVVLVLPDPLGLLGLLMAAAAHCTVGVLLGVRDTARVVLGPRGHGRRFHVLLLVLAVPIGMAVIVVGPLLLLLPSDRFQDLLLLDRSVENLTLLFMGSAGVFWSAALLGFGVGWLADGGLRARGGDRRPLAGATVVAGLLAAMIATPALVLPGRSLPTLQIDEFPVPTDGATPAGIAVGPDGNLWFTESNANKIGRVTTSGAFAEYPIPSARSYPLGIAAGPDGNLWFAERDANKIGRITPSGQITEYPVPMQRSGPIGIAAGRDGALWFTETGSGLGRITLDGAISEAHRTAGITVGIVVAPGGEIWFTEPVADLVGLVPATGPVTEFPVPRDRNPTEIAIGPDGKVWFTETAGNRIGRIDGNGVVTELSVPTPRSGPAGITLGPDGNLWFTESRGDRIGRISSRGAIDEFPLPSIGSFPGAIVTGRDGNLWFVESGNSIGRVSLRAPGRETRDGSVA